MPSEIRTGTAAGLVEFLDYLKAKGLMNANTVNSYRAAASKVFEIEGEAWGALDIRKLDVDDHLSRFEVLAGSNYTPASLATYKRRFARAVEMYIDYLESPSSFKPQIQTRSRSEGKPQSEGKRPELPSGKVGGEATRAAQAQVPELTEYPFPLTRGGMAFLRLPRDLSAADVDRLAAFVRSIVIDTGEPPPENGD